MKCFLLFVFWSVAYNSYVLKGLEDKAYFTAIQSATTSSVLSARQKALIFAKNTLATMVNGKVKNVTKGYIEHNSETGKSVDEFMTETRMTVGMLLQNVEIADENVVQEKKGKYTVYITLKLKKDEVLQALCKRLNENKETKGIFRKDVFTDLWDKENK
ncbi:hypothetical protein [Bacteroides sp. RTP21281st1_E4_RTP21281_210402]|uniref:hypothetical protein n=1 Tax=unclassified Bacteroides TaxID=2646097 RepID=UPI0034A1F8D9